jgi:hypothetical protein
MKTWTLTNGAWEVGDDGAPAARHVHLLSLREGVWTPPLAPFLRTRAEAIIAEAITTKRTGNATAYRLEPAAVKAMPEDVKQRLRAIQDERRRAAESEAEE